MQLNLSLDLVNKILSYLGSSEACQLINAINAECSPQVQASVAAPAEAPVEAPAAAPEATPAQ